MLTKKLFKFNLSISFFYFIVIIISTVFLSCNNSSNSLSTAGSNSNAQTDSSNNADSSNSADSTWFTDSSAFKLPSERQINFTAATIPGNLFDSFCNDADYLYFTFFKNSSLIYKLKCYKINSSSIDVITFKDNSINTIVPATAGTPFHIRGLRISIDKINDFFDGLASESLYSDFKNHPENYVINIKANPAIQLNQGRYFDVLISASPKTNTAVESTTKGRVNPCPPCNAQ